MLHLFCGCSSPTPLFSYPGSFPCSYSFLSPQTWLSLFGTELLRGLVQTAWHWTPKARSDSVSSVKPRGSSSTRGLRKWTLREQPLPRESSEVLLPSDEGQDIKLEGEQITLRALSQTGGGLSREGSLLDCVCCALVLPTSHSWQDVEGRAGDQPKLLWPAAGHCWRPLLQDTARGPLGLGEGFAC